MTAESKTCGTCAKYVEVYKNNTGVCPCAFFMLSQEFTGIKHDTPIKDSACEGEGYEQRDDLKLALSDIRSAQSRLIALRDEEEERYKQLSEGEKLGENGWSMEELINDYIRASIELDRASAILNAL